MAGGKLWTKEEDAILIDCYSKFMSVSEIQKLISRPSGSIFCRAQRLGLTKKYIRTNNINYKAVYQDYDWCFDHFITQGMDMKDMAKEANCSLRTIQKWCTEVHGLSNRTFRYHYQLTPIQKTIILAGTLGDGHITKSNNQTVYIESHAADEKDYLFWKYDKLKELCVSEPSRYDGEIKMINGKAYATQDFYRLSTKCADCLRVIRDLTRIERIAQLNELGLCLHILDDGSRNASNWQICFGDWSMEENVYYLSTLKTKFQLDGHLCKDTQYAILTADSSRHLDRIMLNNLPNNLDIINKKIFHGGCLRAV